MYREPAKMPPDPGALEVLARQRKSLTRTRLVMLSLAIVLPSILFLLFERQARRLDALADHGVRVDAVVTSPSTSGFTHYRYVVDGATYHWDVARDAAPLGLGETLPVRVLPEVPSFSRPGKTGEGAAREAASNRGFYPRLLVVVAAFFALFGVLAHVRLQRIEGATSPPSPSAPPTTRTLSRALAFLFLLVVLGVNADPKVRAVHVAVVGERPLGAPAWLVVSLVEIVLFLPFVPVLEHALRIASAAARDGARSGPFTLLVYTARIGGMRPELVRSRAIAVAGLVYFAFLVGSWIMFTSVRGI